MQFDHHGTSVTVAHLRRRCRGLGLIGSKLRLGGAFWSLIGSLNENLSAVGYAVVGIFFASWTASSLIYRLKGYEAR